MIPLQPLKKREDLPELLDEGDHPDEELFGTFQDMRRVNRLLGGTGITIKAVRRLTGHLKEGDRLSVLDIGAGHGDIPRDLAGDLARSGIECRAFAVDIDHRTIVTARELPENRSLTYVQGDMLKLPLSDRSVDIAMSSMTLHHFDDDEAIRALREMARVSRFGLVVNDLTRSLHGYVVAWLLGRIATGNRLTRHDAHRSIRRGRTEADLAELARRAGLQWPVFDSTLGYRTAMTVGVRPW